MPQRLKPDSTSESNDLRNAGLKVTLPRLKILDILADRVGATHERGGHLQKAPGLQ